MKKYIYALECPTEKTVKYVGQTSDIKKRYSLHTSFPQDCLKKWIEHLKSNSLTPKMIILEEVIDGREVFHERKWMRHYMIRGCDLLNTRKPELIERKPGSIVVLPDKYYAR